MNDSQINAIVEQVVARLSKDLIAPSGAPASGGGRAPAVHSARAGIFDDIDSAVAAATVAQQTWIRAPLETRFTVVAAMREMTRKHAPELSAMAVEETKLGNIKDKIQKNLLCANKTPGPEILRPHAYS